MESPVDLFLSVDAAIQGVFLPLSTGGCLHLLDRDRLHDPDFLIGYLDRALVDVLDCTPSYVNLLLGDRSSDDLPPISLEYLFLGGEQLDAAVLRRAKERLSPNRVINLYGPTEGTVNSAWFDCENADAFERIPIGRPMPGDSIMVLNEGSQVPINGRGELYIGGEGIAGGYRREPELTRNSFLENCESSNERLYRTGDLGTLKEDGNFVCLGRVDDQLSINGFRIEPGEIEHAIYESGLVEEVAVVLSKGSNSERRAYESPDLGSMEKALKAMDEASALELLREVAEASDSGAMKEPEGCEFGVSKKCKEFELSLRICDSSFVRPPSDSQRNWIIRRSVDELVDDLRSLDELARSFVPGSVRPEMGDGWSDRKAAYDQTQLIIDGQQVMQDWERPLMERMAAIVGETRGDILEVGFGMGISGTYIQGWQPASYTVIECNHEVKAFFEKWREAYPNSDIRLEFGTWQERLSGLGTFDGILFDAYPIGEEEFGESVAESVTFAEEFIEAAAAHLNPGGVFTYYSNEIDSLSRRHQRLLLRHYSSFSVEVIPDLEPPQDCHYWWASSMVAVKAIK
ncbi:MAG: AMP-binding protein [Symploca sp. SIO2D2]|nr:AMP-binding protein [Symploca sp. SIO2D2]